MPSSLTPTTRRRTSRSRSSIRSRPRPAGREGAAGRAEASSREHRDHVRARRGVREAEEIHGRRSRLPAGVDSRPGKRGGAQLPGLHARRPRRAPRRVGRLLEKALEIEPDNGSYLDSIGWAYFNENKLDLAEANLRRAAEQLKTNSVIQAHFGEVLFKAGRYERGHRGVEPRVDRRRRRDRSRRARQENPHRETKNQKVMRPLVLAAAVATAACGPPLLKLPTGAGSPIEKFARVHRLGAGDGCVPVHSHADGGGCRQRIGGRPSSARPPVGRRGGSRLSAP